MTMSARPRVLSLAAIDPGVSARYAETWDLVVRPWTETQELADPMELGAELASDGHMALLVEADFVTAEVFDAAPNLAFVGVCRGSTGHIELDAATRAGVVVVHAPGRNAAAVAELTVALTLNLLRHVSDAEAYVQAGDWKDPADPYIRFSGDELGDQTVGIIGLGAIGRMTVGLLQAFGARALAYDPGLDDAAIRATGATPCLLPQLLAEAGVVVVHCPRTEATAGMIDADAIASMGPGTRLVVTTGEGVVDESGVAAALRSGHLAGAAFDVFDTYPIRPDHPLLHCPHAVLVPHIGGATGATIRRHSALVLEDLARFLNGERPQRLANPEVWNHRR